MSVEIRLNDETVINVTYGMAGPSLVHINYVITCDAPSWRTCVGCEKYAGCTAVYRKISSHEIWMEFTAQRQKFLQSHHDKTVKENF